MASLSRRSRRARVGGLGHGHRTNSRPPPAKQPDSPRADGPAAGGGEREKPLYEQVESQTAIAFEEFVSKPSFGRCSR